MIKTVQWISNSMTALATLSVVAMLLLIVGDVLSRTVLNIAIPGIDTIVASYLMVGCVFLPLASLHLLEENITVNVVYDASPLVLQKLFDALANLLAIGFYCLLGWLYFKVAVEAFEIKEYVTGTWDVPIWPARVLMPLGLFMGSVICVYKLLASLNSLIACINPTNRQKVSK